MEKQRPSASSFARNLRAPMPLGRKLRLTVRNVLRRFGGKTCCGHPGEPGC